MDVTADAMMAEIGDLRAELDRARAGMKDLEAEFAALADPDNISLDDEHDSEGSTVGYERARVAGLLERSKRHVADLEAAVDRAAQGSYGHCSNCGNKIAGARLTALPATQICFDCASRAPR